VRRKARPFSSVYAGATAAARSSKFDLKRCSNSASIRFQEASLMSGTDVPRSRLCRCNCRAQSTKSSKDIPRSLTRTPALSATCALYQRLSR
jgi:hypothetical protein